MTNAIPYQTGRLSQSFTTPFSPPPPARPRRSLRARFISLLLDLVTAARDRLVAWRADDYSIRGTEPVLSVTEPGECWTITGRYGKVLVSTTLPIWDVDLDAETAAAATDEELVERLHAVICRSRSEHLSETDRFRAYRTHSGLRIICSTRSVDLRTPEDWAWFAAIGKALGSDPVYMRACQRQFTCRARLEPKPQRLESMGLTRPGARAARLISEDLAGLESENPADHPGLVVQIRLHDKITEAAYSHHLPLA